MAASSWRTVVCNSLDHWRVHGVAIAKKLLGTLMLPGGLFSATVFVFKEVTFTCRSTGMVILRLQVKLSAPNIAKA